MQDPERPSDQQFKRFVAAAGKLRRRDGQAFKKALVKIAQRKSHSSSSEDSLRKARPSKRRRRDADDKNE
jgi:hypothetical protein